MNSEPATGLAIGARIAARFQVEQEHDAGAPGRAFLGVDVESGREIVLVVVAAAHAAKLAPLVGLEHQHLAPVLAVEQVDDQHVLIAEHVKGLTLEQRLALVQKKAPVDAVRAALRLAEALTAIHERGGVHGLVSALSLIVAPEQGPRPRLCFAPGSAAALRAPGSSLDEPSVADDTWAAAALLYWMLAGQPPPEQGLRDPEEARGAGIEDPELAAALHHSLASAAEQRSIDLKPLRRELARWFVEHAGDEAPASSLRGSAAPPPLPSTPRREAGSAAAVAVAPARAARRSRSHLGAFAVVAIGLGLIGGYLFSTLGPKPEVQVVTVPSTPPAPSAPPAIELGDVPVTGDRDRVLGDRLAACVAGYLPPSTFAKTPDVSFVCAESNPRVGAEKLRVAVVASAPRSGPSEAMKIFARIGWYDMAAFAVARAGCCPDAPPLALPKLAPSCPRMDDALREVGEAVVASRPPRPALKRYTDSIHCELNAGHGAELGRTQRPAGGEDSAFLELVDKLEDP